MVAFALIVFKCEYYSTLQNGNGLVLLSSHLELPHYQVRHVSATHNLTAQGLGCLQAKAQVCKAQLHDLAAALVRTL